MSKQTRVERRSPLTERQKQMMMCVLIRRKTAFIAALDQLEVRHFNLTENKFAITWMAVCEHYEEFGELPTEEELIMSLEQKIIEDPDLFPEEADTKQLDEFLAIAYSLKRKDLKENLALKFLRLFLEERLAAEMREAVELAGDMPSDMWGLTQQFATKAQGIVSLTQAKLEDPFPKGWEKRMSLNKFTTTIPFLDDFLNGGHCGGEVYSAIAPQGSCKTTLAVMLSTGLARMFAQEWLDSGKKKPLKLSYLFVYEEPMNAVRRRAISFIGQIDKARLEEGPHILQRVPGQYLDYEKRLFRKMLQEEGVPRMPPERRRFELAQKGLNRNWRPYNMAGTDSDNPGRGGGLIGEVVSLIKQDVKLKSQLIDHECIVGGVVMDYAGAMVKRHINVNGLDHDKVLRHKLGDLPLEASHSIAIPFDVPVWITHQIKGAMNDVSAGRVPKRSDSAECSAFPENADWCFTISNPDVTGKCVISLRKARRAQNKLDAIIQVDGAYCNVHSLKGKYILDVQTRRIVPIQELSRMTHGSEYVTSEEDTVSASRRRVLRQQAILSGKEG